MLRPLLLLPVALLGLSSCKKESTPLEQLPTATQDGNNTAGWLLDGRAWVPVSSTISTGPPISGSWQKTKGGRSLSVSFHQFSREEDWGAGFFLSDIRQPDTFLLNQAPAITGGRFAASYGEYDHLRPGPRLSYHTDTDAPGQLNITRFDTVQNIVSGTFQMTLRQDGGGGTIEITNGRFDVHFDR
jgi:hypothetical protein